MNNNFLGKVVQTNEMLPAQPDIKPADSYKYDVSFGDVMERSFKNDSLAVIGTNKIIDEVSDSKYLIDEKFDAKAELDLHQDLNIHDDLKDHFLSRAKNKEHFDSMLGYYEEQSAYQRELDRYGFGSQLLMGLLPEATNAPIYIGAAAMLPQTAAMMGSAALLRFTTSGSAGAAIEGLKDILGEQDKKALDYAGAVMFDGVLGAAFGKKTNSFSQIANSMVLKSHGMTKDVMARVKKATSKEERNSIINEAYTAHSGKQADKTLLDVLDDNIEYADQNMFQNAWGSLRQDLAYVTGESTSPTMSNFSKKMFPDATLQNLDLNNPDLSTERDLLEETMRGERQKLFMPLIKQYSQIVHGSGGILGIKPSGQTERDFGNILGEIQLLRNIDGHNIDDAVQIVMNDKKLSDPALKELFTIGAKNMEVLATSYHKKLADSGHSDFMDGTIKEDGTYMPFIYNKESIARLRNDGVAEGDIVKFFKQAIINNLEIDSDIGGNTVNAIAMAFFRAVSENKVKRMNTFDSIMDEVLSSENISEAEKAIIKQIQESKYRSNGGDAKGNFTNERTNIDYSHKQTFKTENGGEREISFKDFLSTDYLNNMDTYARKMSGTTVLRKYGWTNDAEMIDLETISPDDFKTHKEYLTAYSEASKKNKIYTDRLIENIKKEQDLVDIMDEIASLRGRQTDEGLELLRGIGKQIAEAIDSKTAKSVDDAFKVNDYQKAADILFKAIESSKVDVDSKRFFELMDEFIDVPNNKVAQLEKTYAARLNERVIEGVNKAHKETEFRMNTKDDYDHLRNTIREELAQDVKDGIITVREADKDLVRLDTILKDMTGIATSKDPHGNLNRFYRIAHSYNVGRLLGQTFFTMPAEAMNIMWDVGLRSFIETVPSIKSLLRAYKNGSIDHAQTMEIQDALGMYDEFLSSPRLYEFDHDFNAATNYMGKASKAVDKLEAWGENFAEFTLMTGGIKPLTAWFQTAHVMGVFKKMRKVAEGGAEDTNYRKTINELGLSKEFEEKVYQNIRDNYKDGMMNFDKWDTETKNVFLVGVKRRTDTLVQMQRLGDKPAWVSEQDFMFKDTFIGKVTMELKQFVMTAYVKQLGRALNRKDQYMIGLMASQMTALTLSYMMKQTLNYAGNEEKFKRAMKPENIVAGTMGMMPQGSVLPMVMNFGSNMVFGRNLIGESRHNSQATDIISSLAIVDGVSKVMEAMTIPSQILTGNFDNKTLEPVAKLTGVSNSWISKALWESTQNE